jgi:hypothetical protein
MATPNHIYRPLIEVVAQVSDIVREAAAANNVGFGCNENSYNKWYDALITAVEDGLEESYDRAFDPRGP